jgi:hypothetical protein
MKRKTISQRYYAWFDAEPFWAGLALGSFALAMFGLTLHLGGGWAMAMMGQPQLVGVARTVGLFMLIGFDVSLLAITFFRRQLWWFYFWLYVTIGVLGFEIASYFFGSQG